MDKYSIKPIDAGNRPTALFVTPCTLRGYAGNISRFEQVIRLLARDYDIDVYSLVERIDRTTEARLTALGVSSMAPRRVNSLAAAVLRVAYKATYLVNRMLVETGVRQHYDFSFFDKVAKFAVQLATKQPYDLLVANYAWTARGLSNLGRYIIVDLHDIHGDRHKRIQNINWVNLHPHDERKRIEEADRALVISEIEYAELSELQPNLSNKLRFFPYWPTRGDENATTSVSRERACVFLGSANPINIAALKRIEGSGLLSVLIAQDVELWICGAVSNTSAAAEMVKAWPKVRQFGVVADTTSVLNRAALGVNLVGPSTGLKIKTVDYLCAGLPVIASSHGSDPWLARIFGNRLLTVPDHQFTEDEKAACANFVYNACAQNSADGALAQKRAEADTENAWRTATSKLTKTICY